MLWFLGFIGTFTVGGIAGVLLAVPPADFQLHNSLFLVAHFHTMVIGGVLFGIFAGLSYWFPKFTGFRLNERIGRYAFWCWISGFCMSFIPLYVLGIMGATRRLDHYDGSTGYQPFYIIAFLGGLVIATGVALQFVQIIASFMQKRRLVDESGDPWDGRTLEWSVPSSPPSYNFTVVPEVFARDAFWDMKQKGLVKRAYEDIHMPRNTASGIYISIFAFLAGFGFVWEIVWLAVVSILAILVCLIVRTFNEDSEYTVKAAEIEKLEEDRIAKKAAEYKGKYHGSAEDMGLKEFVQTVVAWVLKLIRTKQWRTW